MMTWVRALCCFGLILWSLSPAGPAIALTKGETATVDLVIDGDTVALSTGKEVRLVGIQAPKLPLGRRNFKTWPLAPEAKQALEDLVGGKRISLFYDGRRGDRHGRILAHIRTEDGIWAQGEMLRRGLARVYSFKDNRSIVSDLLAIEREARQARRGIWRHRYYQIRDADDLAPYINTFQLVEGRVRAAADNRGRVYLNFGENWKTDFTITVSPADMKAFAKAGVDPLRWQGRRVRVRGWLKKFNGPMIEATHPEQIELLSD